MDSSMGTTVNAPVAAAQHVRAISPELSEQVACWSADVHDDTQQRPDKKAAATHQRNRSRVRDWRTIGRGSPCYAALQYLLRLTAKEAMRVAAMFLSAARMVALRNKSTPELIALYWECRANEVEREARDRALESRPLADWDWTEGANATARDVASDLTKEAIQRIFAVRNVPALQVLTWQGRVS